MKCLYQGQSRLQSHISYIIYESIPRTLALETDHGLVANRFDLLSARDDPRSLTYHPANSYICRLSGQVWDHNQTI
jgi:hypothetical protein